MKISINILKTLSSHTNYLSYYTKVVEIFDEKLWGNTKNKYSIYAFQNYLSKIPNPIHKQEALENIKYISENESEIIEWNNAKKKNTLESYTQYMCLYPQGRYSEIVSKLIEVMTLTNFDEIKISKNFKSIPPDNIGSIIAYKSNSKDSYISKIIALNNLIYKEISNNLQLLLFPLFLFLLPFIGSYLVQQEYIFLGHIVKVIFVLFAVLAVAGYFLKLHWSKDYYIGTKGASIISSFKFMNWDEQENHKMNTYLFETINKITKKNNIVTYYFKYYSSNKYKELFFHKKVKNYFEVLKTLGVLNEK